MLFQISFAVVFGLLVLGLFALRIQATRITSYTVADPDHQIKGGGGGGPGHPDPEVRGGGRPQKNFFSALRASFWSKNKGKGGPLGNR